MQTAIWCGAYMAVDRLGAFGGIHVAGPESSEGSRRFFTLGFPLLEGNLHGVVTLGPPGEGTFGWETASGSDDNSAVAVA